MIQLGLRLLLVCFFFLGCLSGKMADYYVKNEFRDRSDRFILSLTIGELSIIEVGRRS